MAIIELREVVKNFNTRKKNAPEVRAVDGVTLEIAAGEICGIIGYSGAGKSTLVRLINGLEHANSGSITVDGTEIVGLSESGLRKIRREIGMIFQQFNLFSARTVAGNIAYPMKLAGWSAAKRHSRALELLDFVGLKDKANAYPEQLSGGQKQRVGIARALATQPKILLADEATSALDPQTTTEVLELLQRVNKEFGVTVVLITHEMEVIKRIATRVAVMQHGRVVESGESFAVFTNPKHAATKQFVGTVVPAVPAEAEANELAASHGAKYLGTVSIADDARAQQRILQIFNAQNVSANIIAGGVHQIAGRDFTRFTFALDGQETHVKNALQLAAEHAEIVVHNIESTAGFVRSTDGSLA